MKAKRAFVRSLACAMTLAALLIVTSTRAAPEPEKTLYERLGGVYAIAAVVDHFSDALVENPIVERPPRTLRDGNGTRRT
jgi:hemoglobin